MNNSELLLQMDDLRTYFFLDEGTIKAVDGADLKIDTRKTLGVVGESGCGKSVTARSIMRIVAKTGKIVNGKILYHRRLHTPGADNHTSELVEMLDLTQLDAQGDKMRSIRGAEISMVFQEPMTSLSPVHTIGNQIEEVIRLHQDPTRVAAACEPTHLVAGIEHRLSDQIHIGAELALVAVVPELQMTLASGKITGFRKARSAHGCLRHHTTPRLKGD